jgi:hypothetical protein
MRDVPRPRYKVTLTVEDTETGNVSSDEMITEFLMERFQGEITFETDTSEELHEIISHLGILRRVDVDSLVLHTE